MKRLFLLCLITILCLVGCSPKGTQLSDGTYQYMMSNIPNNKTIEFKDEAGNILLNESDIEWVFVKYSEEYEYYIVLDFTDEGSAEFATATRENIGKKITFSVDGKVLYSPFIVDEITDGKTLLVYDKSFNEIMKIHDKITKQLKAVFFGRFFICV